MFDRLKALWQQRRTVVITVTAVVLIAAAVVVAAILITNRPETTSTTVSDANVAFTKDSVNYIWETAPTQDPNADPTRAPELVMADLIGDWRQTGENPSGIIELHLHGDNTAVYVVKGVFDEEPRSINTRWQAQDGLLSLVTEGAEVTQYTLEFGDGTIILSGSYGSKITYEFYIPEPVSNENE